MTISMRFLASGKGWQADDVACTAGPRDRPFEEHHSAACVAVVTEGTFRYRSAEGNAVLAPGSLLLGKAGSCFECGHEHAAGDRCVSFHFSGDFLESVSSAVPGSTAFRQPTLPPSLPTAALVADAAAACQAGDADEFGEIALRVAAAAVSAGKARRRDPTQSDQRRVSEAIRRVEADAGTCITLDELADDARLSPYHFLRLFRQVAGMTPYQYVLRTRLHRAAVRLRTGDEQVSAIAFDTGFGDLSTFNRRFRRVMGMAPLAWRRRFRAGA